MSHEQALTVEERVEAMSYDELMECLRMLVDDGDAPHPSAEQIQSVVAAASHEEVNAAARRIRTHASGITRAA